VTAVVADAQACAAAASAKAGVRVVEMTTVEQITSLGVLLKEVWQAANVDQVANPGLVRALAHAGSYVVGAYHDRVLVGASWAFLGRHEPGGGIRYSGSGLIGELHLHSHITGVLGGDRAGGVGYALKQHQRAWALARGIPEVHWTYDPLIRRNAAFNLRKLGARITRYLTDFYGPMDDGINAGDATDRLYVVWRLDSPGAVAAAHRERLEAPAQGETLLESRDDEPVGRALDEVLGAPHLLVATPTDVERLRVTDPGRAARWRLELRTALGGALAAGYQVAGLTSAGQYLLREGSNA
jgi:predicted GNAT superfamily acetyltransferase